jgi:hypothetical protein
MSEQHMYALDRMEFLPVLKGITIKHVHVILMANNIGLHLVQSLHIVRIIFLILFT